MPPEEMADFRKSPAQTLAYVKEKSPAFIFVGVVRHPSEVELARIDSLRKKLSELRQYRYSTVGGQSPEVFWGHLWIHR